MDQHVTSHQQHDSQQLKHSTVPHLFLFVGLVVYAVVFFLMSRSSNFSAGRDTIILLMGLAMGVGLCIGDIKYVYKYYAFDLNNFNHQFVTRSLLFLLSYFPLGFLIISSSGSVFGSGMMLGIGAYLAQEMWQYKDDYSAFKKRYLFQLARELTPTEFWWSIRAFIGVVVAFLLLALA